MKIVTWNCNGAFRRKFEPVDALDADVLVIQECEDPAQSNLEYQSWAGNYLWHGYGKNKGIGIFPRRGQSIEPLHWPDNDFQLFLPVTIDQRFDLLAVWTQQASPSKFGYIGQFWHYLRLHMPSLGANTIICGDLNSNQIWDKPGRNWNHSQCVSDLSEIGLCSLYHKATGEPQGQESQPTFYLHRHESKPFHIDYVFAHTDQLANNWNDAIVGKPADWLSLSDHMPLIVDI
jgi:exonuclease III